MKVKVVDELELLLCKLFNISKETSAHCILQPLLSHSTSLFKNLNLLNVYDTYEFCIFMYKHAAEVLQK